MTDEQHKNTQVSKQELRTSVTLKDNLMHRFVQWLEDNDLAPHQGLKICIISQLSNYANSLRATTSSRAHVSSNSVISKEIMSSGNSYGNDTTSGYTVGIGYDHEVSNGFSIRAELTGSDFSDVKTTNGQTNKTEIQVKDMIGARGTISLVKSF